MKLAIPALLALALSLPGCLSEIGIGASNDGPKDFLTSNDYTSWTWEIDTNTDNPPSSVLSFAKQRMTGLVNKPNGITVSLDDRDLPERNTWTRSQLDELHREYQDKKPKGDELTTHVLWLGGQYTDPETIGLAVGHQYIAIFADHTITGCQNSLSCTDPNRVLEIVLTHEFGHIIGLVNNGIPMVTNHEHADAPGHSDNQNSIMWPAADTRTIFDLVSPLGGGVPDDFDANDRKDVCSYGGKC